VSGDWNRLRYRLWAPGYDLVGGRIDGARRAALARLRLQPGERVLLVGAGTGSDLPLLPSHARPLATDLVPAMLVRARRKAPGVPLAVMDGARLAVADAVFDAAVLHLVLSVAPQPAALLREVARVLRPGGRAVVFDKFLSDGARASLARRLLNLPVALLFTDLNRRLGEMLASAAAPLRVEGDEPSLVHGTYRIVLLRRA